ncbi:MAG: dihydrolipoyl dehydrogenase [Methanotrichaceae archaeon]|nr:dihydrolipoyl dehydrogenase [Methanotrichaceae archaeon]
MDKFDLIVIGTGAGVNVASQARHEGLQVALVDQGPTGGTCLNNGCIPSKMLIYPADVIRTIQDARAVGVHAGINEIDFQTIMGRMHAVVDKARINLEESLKSSENLTYFQEKAEFIDDYVLKVGEMAITAPKIVTATGARALVPLIPGLLETGFLDNVSLLRLQSLPQSLIIIGAGYIGCEFGHFFSALGTHVTIVGRGPLVLKGEDPEAARLVQKVLSRYMEVITGHEVVSVERRGDKKVVSARNMANGKIQQYEADEILLVAGRRPNTDLLHPEKSGIETDSKGWIMVNEFLESSKKDIWALGDAIGKHMFRHTANYESEVVSHNLLRSIDKDDREAVDYHAVPYAVFTYPQVAGVGMKEADALAAGRKVLIGRAKYTDVAKGVAMAEEHGLVKVILEEESGRILGATVVGPMAPELVQQVVYLMNTEYQDLMPVIKSQVIHPTINEVLVRAFSELEHPYHHHNEGQ